MARRAFGIFGSEHVENISKHCSIGALLEVEMLKSARFVREARVAVQSAKMLKHLWVGPPLEVEMFKNCAQWTFERSIAIFCGKRKGFCTLPKVSKT